MENKKLLYNNQYVPTDVYKGSSSTTTSENFKEYYQERKKQTEKQKLEKYLEQNPRQDWLGRVPQHILTKPDHKFRKFLNNDLMSTNKVDFDTVDDIDYSEAKTTEYDEFRYIKPSRTLLTIDSRDRDITLYPKPDNYRINLKRSFSNVKRISLRSTEFPNSTRLIRDTPVAQANNALYWQNVNNSSTIFSALLTPGNYEPSGLAAEIQTQMNAIIRENGRPHNFRVSIDQVTDIVSISSYTVVGVNDVMSINTSNPNIVTVTLGFDHNYDTGDLIEISGAFTFGNIPTSELNGLKQITILSPTSFSYALSSGSTVTSNISDAGGSIQLAKGADFALFFDPADYPNTVGDILGFEPVNTIFESTQLNTRIKESNGITNIYPLGSFTAIVIGKEHGLLQNTEMRFDHITEFSPLVNNLFSEGIAYLLLPLSAGDIVLLQTLYNYDTSLADNTFKVSIDISSESYQNTGFTTPIENIIQIADDSYAIGVGAVYPVITGMYPYTLSSTGYTAIELDGDHGFVDGDTVIITELGSSIVYTITNLTAADLTELQSSIDPEYDVFDSMTLPADNYFRITVSSISFSRFYRQIPSNLLVFKPYTSSYTGAIPIGARKNNTLEYISFHNVTHTNDGYQILPLTPADDAIISDLAILNPTLNTDVNFKILVSDQNVVFGDSGTIHNGQGTFTRTNNRPVNLSGENYIFMTSPQLDSMHNTGDVTNIFAKLQLAASPGTIIFNSFISNPVVYEDSPLPLLYELDISFREHDNTLVNFNDVNHSFTIEIVEYHDKLRYNDFDSRRGRYDDIRIRQNYYS